MRPKPRLVVMLKEPHPGRVKTRLGADIGMTAAAWWFRHQTQSLLRRLRDPRWDIVLAVTPDREGLQSHIWPADFARWPQGRGTLGDRMGRVFRRLSGPGPVLIIGADVPAITKREISAAVAMLGSHDVVFGPAPDGGYWLIGMARKSRVPARVLQNVRWSSAFALEDSISTLNDMRIGMITALDDIDTVEDLRRLS